MKKFEPNALEDFDIATKEFNEEIASDRSQAKDVAIDQKHDNLVNIPQNIEQDNQHGNPDYPVDP